MRSVLKSVCLSPRNLLSRLVHCLLEMIVMTVIGTSNIWAGEAVVILNDRSDSISKLDPPDQTQAMELQFLDLSQLSGDQTKVAIINFGGVDGLTVFAGDDGLPTSETNTLKHRVLKEFPKLAGATPMDMALELSQQMVSKLPSGTKVTVVLISDGRPESGWLRPKDFPEVAKAMERQRTVLLERCRVRGYSDKITQDLIRQQEQQWADGTTKECEELYRQFQIPAELKKVLQLAQALAKAPVRFVSVDFGGGIAELRDIHQAAGGVPSDLVVCKADEVIRNLHKLGLTELPGVVKQEVREISANPKAFHADYVMPLDPLAAKTVVTFQFHPAIVDWDKHLKLRANVRGTEISLTADNVDERYTVALNGKGHLATVTVVVDTPGDGQVTLHLESPNQSLSMPAASLFSHFRLREGTAIDFRPAHAAAEAKPTFQIAPTHPAVWRFAIQVAGSTQGVPFKGADAILKNERTGDEIKLPLSNDPQFVGRFVSPPTKLPVGKFDAIVSIVTATGATVRIKLPQHVESLLRSESVSLQIPFSADGTIDGASFHPARIDFGGELGDAVTKRYIDLILRSREMDYPLDVVPEIVLADSAGHVVPKEWIKFSRPELTLHPGQAVKLRATLTLPSTYEESVEDGPFTGMFAPVRKDSRQPLQVVPFEKISGGKDDEPVNRVVFVLSRPQPELHSNWAMREWLKASKDGPTNLPVQVAIRLPFERTVTVDVTNTSTISRTFKLLPGGRISDADGRTIHGIELLPTSDSDATRELAPGETGRWTFQFRTDSSVLVKSAEAALHLSAMGLRPQLIMVPIRIRSPLLGPHVKTASIWGAALFGVLAVVSLRRRTIHKAASTGQILLASVKKPIAGLISVVTTSTGSVQLVAERKCQVQMPGEARSRTVHAQQRIAALGTISPQHPIRFEFPGEDNTPPRVIEVTDVAVGSESDAQIQAVIAAGGESDREAVRASQKTFRNSTLAIVCLALALTITAPGVVTAIQWVFDVFYRLR